MLPSFAILYIFWQSPFTEEHVVIYRLGLARDSGFWKCSACALEPLRETVHMVGKEVNPIHVMRVEHDLEEVRTNTREHAILLHLVANCCDILMNI